MKENKLLNNVYDKVFLLFFIVSLYDFFKSLILEDQILIKPIIFMLPFIFILIKFLITTKKRHSF